MGKIQKISDLEPTLAFSEFDFYNSYKESFTKSELGGLYTAFPFFSLSKELELKESQLGRNAYFSGPGKLGLMVLKSYTGLSDSMLLEQLNANIHYQLFCGVRINPLDPLTNFKLISDIRCQIAGKLDIDSAQLVLADYWKGYIQDSHAVMADATCYETYMRYPTDIKILWDAIDWLHRNSCGISKELRLRKARTKYDKQKAHYRSYSKKKKHKQSQTKTFKRSLLHLLNKLIGITDMLLQ